MDKLHKRAPGAGRKPQGVQAKVKTSVAVDPDLLAATEAEAARRGVSRNALIEEAIKAHLERRTQ